jgi:hypothetical protein
MPTTSVRRRIALFSQAAGRAAAAIPLFEQIRMKGQG